jgi:hypothetical protein
VINVKKTSQYTRVLRVLFLFAKADKQTRIYHGQSSIETSKSAGISICLLYIYHPDSTCNFFRCQNIGRHLVNGVGWGCLSQEVIVPTCQIHEISLQENCTLEKTEESWEHTLEGSEHPRSEPKTLPGCQYIFGFSSGMTLNCGNFIS